MKYYNEAGEEIQLEDIDLDIGYLQPFQGELIAHHEAIAEIPYKYHYELQTVFFNEGHCIADLEPDDPRIIIIDDQTGEFDFKSEEGWTVRHIITRKVVDQEYVPGRAAWDEYEENQKYILYTQEELNRIAQEKEREAQRQYEESRKQEFLDTGYITLDELTLAVADIIGA